jgi:hypothetical protein
MLSAAWDSRTSKTALEFVGMSASTPAITQGCGRYCGVLKPRSSLTDRSVGTTSSRPRTSVVSNSCSFRQALFLVHRSELRLETTQAYHVANPRAMHRRRRQVEAGVSGCFAVSAETELTHGARGRANTLPRAMIQAKSDVSSSTIILAVAPSAQAH